MNRIQRENHKTGSYKIKKPSLSFFDDKKFIFSGIDLMHWHQILSNGFIFLVMDL